MDYLKKSIEVHKQKRGKIEICSKVPLQTREDLSIAYTPGVAGPSLEIARDTTRAYDLTSMKNSVAVITDGSAVLGLGDIGPEAALPVMEGKAILFKKFAGIDAIPLVLGTKDVDEFAHVVRMLAPTFGGINLEDISAPRCFEIEEKLKMSLDIPVFHDDQHGTAIVVLAALMNALKIVGKKKEDIRVVMSGAGAAGVAVAKILFHYGIRHIVMNDSKGIISRERTDLLPYKKELLQFINLENEQGNLRDVLHGKDVFIGVSKGDILSADDISRMNKDAIVFALANPDPEIMPEEARKGGARIIATGRSDFPNQVNNALVFPGIFKGVLSIRARAITEEMKIAAAEALARAVMDLSEEKIIPSIFEGGVADAVAEAVIKRP